MAQGEVCFSGLSGKVELCTTHSGNTEENHPPLRVEVECQGEVQEGFLEETTVEKSY